MEDFSQKCQNFAHCLDQNALLAKVVYFELRESILNDRPVHFQTMEAILFDFNGTLFWDTEKHLNAYKIVAQKLRKEPLSDEEFMKCLNGRPNKDNLEYLAGHPLSDEEVEKLVTDKESSYREIVRKERETSHLAPGAIDLLLFLKDNKIPATVATSSEINNVKFFIEFFELKKYFDTDKFVYDDNTFAGKPAPDIYLIAAKKLGVDPSKCIVFEDSVSGIKAAHAAHVGQIYAIVTDESYPKVKDLPGVTGCIRNFTEFDRSVLKIAK